MPVANTKVKKSKNTKQDKTVLKTELPSTKVRDSSRKVVHDEIRAVLFTGANGVTPAYAMELLGWRAESDNVKPKAENVLFTDMDGKRIECYHNIKNRPFYSSIAYTYKQEILMKRWVMNGEPFIIGKTGLVLNGQHTLVALVLAEQELRLYPGKWLQFWDNKSNVTIDKLIVYGVEEDDATINSMDTAKPRSLKDVIFRSPYFSSLTRQNRVKCAAILDGAIRFVWQRTNASANLYAPRRTHAEAIDFLRRHPKLVPCVDHIWAEASGSPIVPLGKSAGMLYLMGCSGTEPSNYYSGILPDEGGLSWDLWDKACDFWALLYNSDSERAKLRQEIASLEELGCQHNEAAVGVVAAAWELYAADKPISPAKLKLATITLDNEIVVLESEPVFGGIDMTAPADVAVEEEVVDIEKTKGAKRKKKKNEPPLPKPVKPRLSKARRKGDQWAKGDVAWVHDIDELEPYLAKVTDGPYQTETGETYIMVAAADGVWEVDVDWLSLSQVRPSDD